VLADNYYSLEYVPGPQNTVTDALSPFSFTGEEATMAVCGISSAFFSRDVVVMIQKDHADDLLTVQILHNLASSPLFSQKNGLLYFKDNRIVIAKNKKLRETLLHDAHGHLGPRKTFKSVSASSYWSGTTDWRLERSSFLSLTDLTVSMPIHFLFYLLLFASLSMPHFDSNRRTDEIKSCGI
jgi:hypothetical protein